MADNRLYIVDTETGEALFVAKSMSKHGWEWMQTDEQMDRWLESRDLGAVYDARKGTVLAFRTELDIDGDAV